MGTTLTALNAGSLAYKYVVAIEGYSYLLTNASPIAAINAWLGTDWTQALDGLFVEIDNQGRAHPWEPFQGGGTCTLRVMDSDGNDTFGIDTHRKLAGAETYLVTTIDRFSTTITVKDTSAFPSSGEAFIGTECFAYAGKTATTFTGCTRGRYAALTTGTGAPWAGHHRQGLAGNRVSLDPIVSAQPRTWIGRWVAVYLHRDIGGLLDSKVQAQLVFAGKIDEVRDHASGYTVVQLKHVMDIVAEASIGRDQFTAKAIEGVYLRTGFYFGAIDWNPAPGSTFRLANDLTVVASGASGANQINQGYYSLGQICDAMNAWFASELAASRLFGQYTIASPVPSNVGLRTKIYWSIAGTPNTQVLWAMRLPTLVAILFGFSDDDLRQPFDDITTEIQAQLNRYANTNYLFQSAFVPYRAIITHVDWGSGNADLRMGLTDEIGEFVDQTNFLPGFYTEVALSLQTGLPWGVFSFNDQGYFVAAKDGAELRFILPAIGFSLPGSSPSSAPWSGPVVNMAVRFDEPGDIVIRQLVSISDTFGDLLKRLFYGSGSSDFNSLAFDQLGYGLGIAIPGQLLGVAFEASVDALPQAAAKLLLLFDKALKLSDLIGGDLTLRWAFPRWRQGGITFASWSIPVTVNSVATLTENSKARPANTQINDRAETMLSEEWVHDIVTILYNRDSVAAENYLSRVSFEDAAQVDDSGGTGRPITIKARNTYGHFVQTGQGVEELAPNFLATLPLFSRPFRKATLSIGPALYEQLAPGDVVTVSESFARDPATGRRGISARAALVIRVRYNRGGAQPSNPRGIPAQGEVDLMFGPDQSRPAPYSYAATVDETVSGGGFSAGYNAGTLTLRCKTHDNSESSEARDASRFVSGDKILIIERDPSNPASPLSWQRTVNGTPVNDDIVINSALAAPTFDAAKKYRIIYDHFAAQQQSQQSLAAQADDADALIENVASPFQYSETTSQAAFTAYDPSLAVELVPNASYGDGKPLDVGHEFALVQLANVLADYRTARRNPWLSEFVLTNSTGTGTYQLFTFFPVHLPTIGARVLSVAPFFRSNTGASVSVRISLCRSAPIDDTLFDSTRPALFSEAVFTTSSTTFNTPSALDLDTSSKDDHGIAWIWIEGTFHAECRGLARCDEGPRA